MLDLIATDLRIVVGDPGFPQSFDFNIPFEDVFLSILPSGIFLLLAAVRLERSLHERSVLLDYSLKWSKLARLHIFLILTISWISIL